MERAAWVQAFLAELLRLRPHLAPTYGTSKFLEALAATEYTAAPETDPAMAAQRYHERAGANGSR